jgi:hypothetical protein
MDNFLQQFVPLAQWRHCIASYRTLCHASEIQVSEKSSINNAYFMDLKVDERDGEKWWERMTDDESG